VAKNGFEISATSLAALTGSVLVASILYHFGFFFCIDVNLLALVDYSDYLRNSVLFLPFSLAMVGLGALHRSLSIDPGADKPMRPYRTTERHVFFLSAFLFFVLLATLPLALPQFVLASSLWFFFTLSRAADSLERFSKRVPLFVFILSCGSLITFTFGYAHGARLILSADFKHRIQVGSDNIPVKIIKLLSGYIIYQRQADGRVCVAKAAEKYSELFCSSDLPRVAPRIVFYEGWQADYARHISVPTP
jgi:hypothetical protein